MWATSQRAPQYAHDLFFRYWRLPLYSINILLKITIDPLSDSIHDLKGQSTEESSSSSLNGLSRVIYKLHYIILKRPVLPEPQIILLNLIWNFFSPLSLSLTTFIAFYLPVCWFKNEFNGFCKLHEGKKQEFPSERGPAFKLFVSGFFCVH